MDKIKILVVDDALMYRTILKEIISGLPDVELVGMGENGKKGLELIEVLKPDFVTLDIEMPEMDGLEVLKALKDKKIDTTVLVVSSITKEGSVAAIKALELGAFDFITKSEGKSQDESKDILKKSLEEKIAAYRKKKEPKDSIFNPRYIIEKMRKITSTITLKREIVCIGISTGGPVALARILPCFPSNFSAPIVIVQHMPPLFTQSLVESLNFRSELKVFEVVNNQEVENGKVYVAPGGKQMKIVNENGKNIFKLTDEPPENNCKPSIDYLFRSASLIYGEKTLAVIMTGMGNDGVLGLKLLKRRNAYVLAQNAETSVVYGMPREAVEAGVVDEVVGLEQIPDRIIAIVKGK